VLEEHARTSPSVLLQFAARCGPRATHPTALRRLKSIEERSLLSCWLADSEFTCATNMPPPGREVQAERPGTLLAYRVR